MHKKSIPLLMIVVLIILVKGCSINRYSIGIEMEQYTSLEYQQNGNTKVGVYSNNDITISIYGFNGDGIKGEVTFCYNNCVVIIREIRTFYTITLVSDGNPSLSSYSCTTNKQLIPVDTSYYRFGAGGNNNDAYLNIVGIVPIEILRVHVEEYQAYKENIA